MVLLVRSTRRMLAFACLLSLFGCLADKRMSDIGTTAARVGPTSSAALLPAGVKLPPLHHVPYEVDGLYPSTVPNDPMCCWIASRARVRTTKSAVASQVHLTIFVPPYPFFEHHPQGLSLSIGRAHFRRRCCYPPGVHTLSYELPSGIRTRIGEIVLMLATDYDFVPANEHVNADSRHLGVVLSRVDYPPDTDAK
jgi:hypothetical protein